MRHWRIFVTCAGGIPAPSPDMDFFDLLLDLCTQYLVTHKILLPRGHRAAAIGESSAVSRRLASDRPTFRQQDATDQQNLDRLFEPYATEHSCELNDLRTTLPEDIGEQKPVHPQENANKE